MFKQKTTVDLSDLMESVFGSFESTVTGIVANDTIREFDSGMVVEIELPGVKKSDVSIDIVDGTLVVKAEKKKPTDGKTTTDSRRYGTITKKYTLNGSISTSDITAKMEDGVLYIKVPKPAAYQPKKVVID